MAKKQQAPPPRYEVSERAILQAKVRPYQRDRQAPLVRPLKIYTIDPSVSSRHGGVATVLVPYEKLEPGPIGALFHVSGEGAPPPLKAPALDLDDPQLLLTNGLSPEPSDGRFHLQMVYAVCSLTYAAFRRALGRDIAWSIPSQGEGPSRLVVRPFGFRGRNAGYSREAGDLSFGYFSAGKSPAGFVVRNGLICTALSHDIIAHETTHALLDGLRGSFDSPSNVDVPAFHEGFSDIVALFLHFTYADIVERAIRESGGAITRGSLLSDLAREFGFARSKAGHGTPLRSGVDVEGVAAFDSDVISSKDHAPACYDPALDEHALGSVLASAVFEAFTTVVRRKTESLFRIAGLDPSAPVRAPIGDELAKAIAHEASDVAHQFLDVCIRAIDYCPPTDMELGEYLRALITADGDLERADKWGFREALMRSFRRREIFPDHVQFMTEAALRWQPPGEPMRVPGLAFSKMRFADEAGRPADIKELERQAHALGGFVTDPRHAGELRLMVPGERLPKGVTYAAPACVQSVRVSRRVAPDGGIVLDTVAEITQSFTVLHAGQAYDMNGGCTLVIDPRGEIRYGIYKRPDSDERRARQLAAMRGPLAASWQKTGRSYRRKPPASRRV